MAIWSYVHILLGKDRIYTKKDVFHVNKITISLVKDKRKNCWEMLSVAVESYCPAAGKLSKLKSMSNMLRPNSWLPGPFCICGPENQLEQKRVPNLTRTNRHEREGILRWRLGRLGEEGEVHVQYPLTLIIRVLPPGIRWREQGWDRGWMDCCSCENPLH